MLVPVDFTNEMVASVVRQLSGAANPGGTDLVSLQQWLLQYRAATADLRQIVRDFGD